MLKVSIENRQWHVPIIIFIISEPDNPNNKGSRTLLRNFRNSKNIFYII